MKNRALSLLLALVMVFGLLPLTARAVTDSEPNNTLATAQDFTMGDTISGVISENKDADWYTFTLDTSGRISFKFTSYMKYYSVWLYDEEGGELWVSYGNAANSNTGMRADTYDIDLIEGSYYLIVSGKYNVKEYATGNYTLTTSYINANVDETEPNDTMQDAQKLSLNTEINGQCALNNREDYFTFELPADGELTLTFTSYMNYYSLWLFDSDGSEIWSSYGNAANSNTAMRVDTYAIDLIEGIYCLKVSGKHNTKDYSTGNYTFKLNTENPFTDVPSNAFYYDPVLWAVYNNITTGATATTFNPGDPCLRAHVVTFLHRAAKNPNPTSTRSPFSDVKPSDFFYKSVLWAVEKGITNGISSTEFGSGITCNRAAVVTFLWRAAGSPEPKSTSNPFADVKTTDFFYKPVLWAIENGITNGVDAAHFGPASPCNRAQVVTFLYRAYN